QSRHQSSDGAPLFLSPNHTNDTLTHGHDGPVSRVGSGRRRLPIIEQRLAAFERARLQHHSHHHHHQTHPIPPPHVPTSFSSLTSSGCVDSFITTENSLPFFSNSHVNLSADDPSSGSDGISDITSVGSGGTGYEDMLSPSHAHSHSHDMVGP